MLSHWGDVSMLYNFLESNTCGENNGGIKYAEKSFIILATGARPLHGALEAKHE
jgi:hypothetical protein